MSLHLLHADTYLAMIEGSIGTQAYRHAYGLVDGQRTDLTQNGTLSCAFFVSDVLRRFRLLQEPHLRVQGTMRDLRASGWEETATPKPGDVLVWEPITDVDGERHFHIGFYVGGLEAISNLTSKGAPGRHHWTFGEDADGQPTRRIVNTFTHPTFFQEASYR